MMRVYNSDEINVIVTDTNNLAYIEGAIMHYADEDESRVLVYCEGFRLEVEGEYGHVHNARGMEFDEFVETVAFFDEDVARRMVCDRMTGYEATYRGLEYLADVFCSVDPYALQTAIDCNHVFICDASDACEFEEDGASVYQDAAITKKEVPEMTDSKVKFMEVLKPIFNACDGDSGAHTCTAWHLAGAVADGLMPLECAEELMQKIGKEITRSNDYHYNCGYTNGYDDAEGNIGVRGEDW